MRVGRARPRGAHAAARGTIRLVPPSPSIGPPGCLHSQRVSRVPRDPTRRHNPVSSVKTPGGAAEACRHEPRAALTAAGRSAGSRACRWRRRQRWRQHARAPLHHCRSVFSRHRQVPVPYGAGDGQWARPDDSCSASAVLAAAAQPDCDSAAEFIGAAWAAASPSHSAQPLVDAPGQGIHIRRYPPLLRWWARWRAASPSSPSVWPPRSCSR